MNAPPTLIPTPNELVTQWNRKLRGLAFTTGVDFDDVRQTAWLLAAEMDEQLHVGCWLAAVQTQVLTQRFGITIYPDDDEHGEYIDSAWLHGSIDDDPCAAIEAAQTVARAVGGAHGDDTERWQRIRQEIDLARAPWEIATARQVSDRQGRRDAAAIKAAAEVQRDLFSADESEGVTA